MARHVTLRGSKLVRARASHLFATLLVTSGLFAPSFLVLAQAQALTSTSTTTDATAVPRLPQAADLKWYQSDWLSGEGLDRGDFVVGPGKIELVIKPGETVVQEITVANRISDNRTFELYVEDIAGSTDGSSVSLLGQQRGPYTLKDYISFPGTQLTLDRGERARIPVTISIPPDAEPGGKYGSVLVTTVRGSDEGGEDNAPAARSPIIARLGILFFITVPGDIERAGETVGLSLIENPWWYEQGPINFGVSYENRGSVHLNPYGEMRITNMFGEDVSFQELEPWFVLPQSLRTREISWDREFLLGRYTATVAINRGYDDIVDERSVTFWVLPWKIVGGVFLGLFILIFAVRTFLRTFEFKRKAT